MSLFAFYQGCQESERAFQAIGGGNPNLIDWMKLASGDDEKDEETKTVTFTQLHLIEQIQKTPDLKYLTKYLLHVSEVRDQNGVSPWIVDLKQPLTKGTIGRIFSAKSPDPSDQKAYALKASKIKDHQINLALAEIAISVVAGEAFFSPPVYDAWVCTEDPGVNEWREILHQTSLGYYFCMVTEKLPDGVLPLDKFLESNPNDDRLIAVAAAVFKRIADMHSLKILHNRLKLYNVVIQELPTSLPRAWILNFGEVTVSRTPLTGEQRDLDSQDILEAFENALKDKDREHDWRVAKSSYPL